jgi:hypothetical protein
MLATGALERELCADQTQPRRYARFGDIITTSARMRGVVRATIGGSATKTREEMSHQSGNILGPFAGRTGILDRRPSRSAPPAMPSAGGI